MTRTEWICTHCGKKEIRTDTQGRPSPGTCPRKDNSKPHTWTKNRTL